MNIVILSGIIASQPRIEYNDKGAPYCAFRLDTGQGKIPVICWRRDAQRVGIGYRKGQPITLEGTLVAVCKRERDKLLWFTHVRATAIDTTDLKGQGLPFQLEEIPF